MKKFFLIVAAVILVVTASQSVMAQAAGDYRSVQSGNWNDPDTWEIFNGVTWIGAAVSPTSTDGVITILNPNIVTISASGLSYDQVVVDSGAQVTVASTITHTLANGTGTDLTINGTWLNQGGTWTITASATWSAGSGGTYIHNTTSGIATPLNSATFNAASNFIYRGSSSLTPAISTSNRTYGNLNFESTSGTWAANPSGAGTLTINGDFTIGSGVTYSTSQSGTMTFAGNFTNNGTLTNSANTQIYAFTGSGKTIGGSGAIEFETWNVNSGASITLGTGVSIAATFTGTISGSLNCATNVVAGAGTFALASGGTLGIGDSNGITLDACGTGPTCGNIRTTTRTFNAGASYTYNGNVAQNTGTGLPTTISGVLTNSNTSAPVTLTQSTVLNGGVSIPVGTDLRIGNGVTLTSNINPTIGGTLSGSDSTSTFLFTNTTLTNSGTISVANTTFDRSSAGNQDVTGAGAWTGTGTLTFAGSGDTVRLLNSTNFSAGVLLISSATLDISVNPSIVLTFGGTAFTNNGSFTPGSTSTVVFNRAGTTTLNGSTGTTFNNQTINSGTTLQLSTGANPTINDTITINGTIITPDTVTVASDGTATLTMGSTGLIQTADVDGVTGSASTSFGTGFTTTSIDTNGTVEYNRSVAGTQSVTDRDYNNLTITGGTSIKSWSLGATRTVNGTVTINSGSLFQISGPQTLNINGDWNNSAGSGFSAQCFSTVVFNGPTNQSMGGGTFSSFCHVTVSTNGTLTLNTTVGGMNVSGNLIISSGSTLNANNKSVQVSGAAFTNDGTYIAGGVSQFFQISSASNFVIGGTSSTTFANLVVNNPGVGTTTMVTSCTVTGNLTLDDDLTVTSPAILTQSGASVNSSGGSAATRDVIGTVKRTDLGPTARAFGNPFNTIRIDSGTAPTEMTVTLVKSEPTGPNVGFSTAVKRTYTLTPTGGAGYSATVRLHYSIADDSELNGNDETSANFDLWRHNGVNTWQRQVKTGSDTSDNWLEKSGVTQFSLWTMAGSNPAGPAPTAVRMTRFNAASYSDGVQLSWDSGFEVNNLGYHVYRVQNGKRTRATPSVVAGSALTVGAGSRLTAGYSYSWFDPQGTSDSVYELEAIDLDGSRQWAGPIVPYAAPGANTSPRRQRTKLLNELVSGLDNSAGVNISEWPAALMAGEQRLPCLDCGVEPRHSKVEPRSKVSAPFASLAVQQAIAAGKAVKIQVRQSGWYRVTQAELVAAGFEPASDAHMLQLYVEGEEVPISLSSDGAQLGANDTLEFYGIGLDTPTTDTQTYWLISGNTPGQRMVARRGKLKPDKNSEPVPGSFDLTVERRERLLYASNLLNGEVENLFGAPIFDEPVNQTMTLRNIDRESVSQAHVEVALQGLSAGNHRVELQLNGASLGTMTFSGREHPVARFPINQARFVEGDNVVSLVSTNGSSDVSVVDWLRLTYPRQYRVYNNSLRLSVPGGQALRIHGFSNPNVRVVDVTDPNLPIQLSASAATSGGGYSVKVQPSGNGQRILIAFTDELSGHPASITANRMSAWNAATNGADMVIITHRDFSQAIEPLATLRRNQGLSVAVVDVEDVYDEFSYGAHTSAAIKDFLMSAAANWSRKPQYLLLVGDSSWDPRNYLGQGKNDFVPTKLIDTEFMETGSDDWLADFNNAGLSSLAVGRLPGRTAGEVSLMVGKILSYEQERELNAPLRGAVMVGDTGFEPQNTATGAQLPAVVTVQTINRSEVGNDDVMRGQVVDALNQGPMLVNYYGHGSVRVWTSAGLLDSNLAANLTNANRLSLFVMMTCLNGYASDANIDSLGEAALKAPNGGAVAVWASSGFTTPQPQFEMNTEFYRLLFGAEPMRLGDATRNAKAATSDLDVRRTWILLGDPAMRIR